MIRAYKKKNQWFPLIRPAIKPGYLRLEAIFKVGSFKSLRLEAIFKVGSFKSLRLEASNGSMGWGRLGRLETYMIQPIKINHSFNGC